MQDQADELRQLVQRVAEARLAAPSTRPKMIVVAGGKGGVGTTSVAVNVAIELARLGISSALVDGDFNGPDVAELCRAAGEPSLEIADRLAETGSSATIDDVLSTRRDVREALQSGPLGIEVLRGSWAGRSSRLPSDAAQQRLVEQLAGLGDRVDAVTIDAGSGLNAAARRFWRAADEILLVVTADDVSVMDAYAAIKAFLPEASAARLQVVVNRAVDRTAALDAGRRLAEACRRFLDLSIAKVEWIEADDGAAEAAREGVPLAIGSPNCTAAEATRRIAQSLLNDGAIRKTEQPAIG
jgi:flagellar biosynthesis protein FlhG